MDASGRGASGTPQWVCPLVASLAVCGCARATSGTYLEAPGRGAGAVAQPASEHGHGATNLARMGVVLGGTSCGHSVAVLPSAIDTGGTARELEAPRVEDDGYFGRWMVGLGDRRAGGREALAVLVPGSDAAGEGGVAEGGRLYLYRGDEAWRGDPPELVSPPAGSSGFGAGIDRAGDVDGDEREDLVVADREGRVAFVVYGSEPGAPTSPRIGVLAAREAGRAFGRVVAGAGDLNGDEFGDVFVGDEARGFVFLGGAYGDARDAAIELPLPAGAEVRASGVGDVDGDGCDDLLLAGSDGSAVHVVLYRGARDVAAGLVVTELAPLSTECFAHIALAGVGDVNADGFADVVLGVPGRGAVELFLGGASGLARVPDATLRAPTQARRFGTAVLGVGDQNGDGFADVLVGSPEEGRAHLYRGGPAGLESVPAWSAQGPASRCFAERLALTGQ